MEEDVFAGKASDCQLVLAAALVDLGENRVSLVVAAEEAGLLLVVGAVEAFPLM